MLKLPRVGAIVIAGLVLAAAPVRADKVESLSRTLTSDPSYKVRVHAALVLGKLGNRRAVPALVKALKDSNATVRGVSCGALGRLGDRGAIDALRLATKDKDGFVRSAATKAIAQIEGSTGGSPGKAKFYLNVGPIANKTRAGGAQASRVVREVLVRELGKTPDVTLAWDRGTPPSAAALKRRKMTGYYLDGSIVRLSTSSSGSYAEISCDLKMFIATWPGKSMIMFTSGGAAVQTGTSASAEQAARRDCLEAAAQAVHQNVVTFLKAQR